MQINWFEITAQVINFFIILFILQKFFYGPVMDVMEKRQKKIQESLMKADRKMEEAKKLITEYNEKIANIDKERGNILGNARRRGGK